MALDFRLHSLSTKSKMTMPRHLLHPPSPSPCPPPSPTKLLTPTLLIIIIVFSILFLISSLIYFLIKFLSKKPQNPQSNTPDSPMSTAQALQRQLQQLFSLHDTGLDQASIDALPVFTYKEILGPKEPFDCAVCLSEFSPKDKLRLLPNCTHAFHIKCIDTWLQSNSTCPLCRGAIFTHGVPLESPVSDCSEVKPETEEEIGAQKGVLSVRLGKFRKLEGGSFVGEASSSNLDARRCYSMGSYEYVVGNTNLRVALCPRMRKGKNKGVSCEKSENSDEEGRRISSVSRGDSYSISKIWLWKKKGASSSSGSSGIAQIDLPHLTDGIESPVMV